MNDYVKHDLVWTSYSNLRFKSFCFPDVVSGDGIATHDVQEVVAAERHDGLQVGPLELGPLGRLQRGPGLQPS